MLPVAIRGTRECLKPDSLHVRPGNVTVRFGEPIPTVGMTHRDAGRLTDVARSKILEMLSEPSAVADGSPLRRNNPPATAGDTDNAVNIK